MEDKVSIKNKKLNYIFILLLLGLLFLRFPFVFLLSYHKIPISSTLGLRIYHDGAYLIIAMLIILKRNVLSDYNIDFSSLLIFIIAPITEILSEYLFKKAALTSADSADQFKIVISICLLIVLLLFYPKLRKRSIKVILLWILTAVVAGICGGVFMGIIFRIQSGERMPDSPSIFYFTGSFFVQLSNAAVIEEPLFRGFLWGFLRNIHRKDYWIWLFQSALFMLGHIYYLGVFNYSFWIIVPLSGLILGLLAWRSRSIGTSMIAHGLFNSVADSIAHFTW